MNKTLKDLTLEQIKALAFDTLVDIEKFQNNLRILNQEIAERSKEKPQEKVENKKE